MREVLRKRATHNELLSQLGPGGLAAALRGIQVVTTVQSMRTRDGHPLLPGDLTQAVHAAEAMAPQWAQIIAGIRQGGPEAERKAEAWFREAGIPGLWSIVRGLAPGNPQLEAEETSFEETLLDQAAQMTPEQLQRAAELAAQSGHPGLLQDLEAFKSKAEGRRAEAKASEDASRFDPANEKGDARELGRKGALRGLLADPQVQRLSTGYLARLGISAEEGRTPAETLLTHVRAMLDGSAFPDRQIDPKTGHWEAPFTRDEVVSFFSRELGAGRGQVDRILAAVDDAETHDKLLARLASNDAEARKRAVPVTVTDRDRQGVAHETRRRKVLEQRAEQLGMNSRRPREVESTLRAALEAKANEFEGRPARDGWKPSRDLVRSKQEEARKAAEREPSRREILEAAYDTLAKQPGTQEPSPAPQETGRRASLETAYDAQAGEGAEP